MKIVAFLVLLFVYTALTQNPCDYSSCVACVANSNCGFCGETGECLPGNKFGPSPSGLVYSNFSGCPARWQYAFGSIIIQTVAGFPIDPSEGDIYLYRNDALIYPVNITRPPSDDVQIDLSVNQDASGSMGTYMQTFANSIPPIIAGIISFYRSSFFQSNSYIDKPLMEFGYLPTDYQIQFNTPGLELRPSLMQIASYKAISSLGYGYDFEENPLDAIAYSLVCRSLMKWRQNSRKFIFTATDAGYHEKGHFLYYYNSAGYKSSYCRNACNYAMVEQGFCKCNTMRPSYSDNCNGCNVPIYNGNLANNYCYAPNLAKLNASLYSSPRNSMYPDSCPFQLLPFDGLCHPDLSNTQTLNDNNIPYMNRLWGLAKDYPTPSEIGDMLKQYDTIPIFGYTSYGGTRYYYPSLVATWGFGKYVNLGSTGEYVISALLDSIEEYASTIRLTARTPGYHVSGISPEAGYTGVQVLQLREFEVTFFSSTTLTANVTQYFSSLGFPDVSVRIWSKIPCIGCDGVPNSGATIDRCFICNPTVRDTCVGCDGIPFSGASLDSCGECKGNNTCYGCDAIKNSGVKLDFCGVCGGDNSTCTGCDNVTCHYLDPLCKVKVVDACNVCGGNGDCYGCDGNFYTNYSLIPVADECGICGGNNACVGCDGIPYSGKVFDLCGECGGENECIGCDGIVANISLGETPAVNDICGVCGGDSSSCTGCDGSTSTFPPLQVDRCGVCGGNDSCLGCDGIAANLTNGEIPTQYDECGICGGDNDCFGCDGKKYDILAGEIPAQVDLCGICGGNNTCIGCDGVMVNLTNGDLPAVVDQCGVCDGNDDCIGCDGVKVDLTVESKKTFDECGVCDGNNECVGCDGVPFSGIQLDGCGICGGDNRTCSGCEEPPVPYSNLTLDRCGICGGNDSCIVVTKIETPSEISPAGIVGIVIASILGAAIGIIVPILYMSYQSVVAGANWFLPAALKSQLTNIKNNPHYKGKKGPSVNPLAKNKVN